MWYSVDFYKLALNYQLVDLRKPKLMACLYSIIKPLLSTHYSRDLYRNDNIYKLNDNGQGCNLRKALNDKFDKVLRRIYIDGTGGDAQKTYIYTPAENQTKYLGTLYIHNSLEFEDTGADFLVYVPEPIVDSQNFELRALIDFYKLGGKRYLIIEIEP